MISSSENTNQVAKAIVIICIILIGLFQGGFYSALSLLTCILLLAFLPFSAKKLPPKKVLLPLISIVFIYLISGIVNNVGFDGFAFVFRPVLGLVFLIVVYNIDDKAGLLKIAICSAFALSVISILAYATGLPGMVSVGRLHGTFQYANATGIYFAAASLMALSAEEKKIEAMGFVLETALILTQSVGALLCYALGLALVVITAGKDRTSHIKLILPRLIISAASAVLIYVLTGFSAALGTLAAALVCVGYLKINGIRHRISSLRMVLPLCITAIAASLVLLLFVRQHAANTYLERLIQLSDGLGVIIDRPILGIGPGIWHITYPFYQSYPYDSAYLHSSIGQIAVDAGIFGLAAFIWLGITYLKKRTFTHIYIAGLIIIVHSLLDITLNFTAVFFLLIIIYRINDEDEPVFIKRKRLAFLAYIPLLLNIYLFSGVQLVGNMDTEEEFLTYGKYFPDSYENGRELLSWYAENSMHIYAAEVSLPFETAETYYIKSTASLTLGRSIEAWSLAVKCIESAPMQDLGYELAELIMGGMEEKEMYEQELRELLVSREERQNILTKRMTSQ